MISHGVDVRRYRFASFVYGRGWMGHRTAAAAYRAARRAATFGQQWLVARTDTGETVTDYSET
jgi:hypothetical protein